MARLKAYIASWWERHIVCDFDQVFPGEPWLF